MIKLKIVLATFALSAGMVGARGLQAHEMNMSASAGLAMHSGMMGEMKIEDMKEELHLSDEQMTKMEAVHKGHEELMKTLEGKLKFDMEQLKALVAKKASNEKLLAGVKAAKAAHVALMQVHQKQHEDMQALLTPLQLANMMISMNAHMYDGMMRGHEGKDDDKEDEKEEAQDKKK